MMHYASLKSLRLKKVMRLLKRRKCSQLDIQQYCFPITSVTSTISELGKNGIFVDRKMFPTKTGRKIMKYWIEKKVNK